MSIDELAVARAELAEKVANTLDCLMQEFKTRTGVAVRELDVGTISQNYMDGRIECLISRVDVQLDIQVRPRNDVGANTLIEFR